MSDALREHARDLSEQTGLKVDVTEEGKQRFVVVHGFPIPRDGWSVKTTDVLFVGDAQYPMSSFDMFWTSVEVTLADGATPKRGAGDSGVSRAQVASVQLASESACRIPSQPSPRSLLVHGVALAVPGGAVIRLALDAETRRRIEMHLHAAAPREGGAYAMVRSAKTAHGTRLVGSQAFLPPNHHWEHQGEDMIRPTAQGISAAISRAYNAESA